MSGFVYIWFDRKHKRYYVGSHWGTPDDGYICSSSWMNSSYKKRPQDFKRRIITTREDRKELLAEEQRFLCMIKDDEKAGKRYYNLNNGGIGHWTTDDQKRLTVGQKISAKVKGQKRTPEQRARKKKIMSERIITKEEIDQRSASMKANWESNPERREEFRNRMMGKQHGLGYEWTPERYEKAAKYYEEHGGRHTKPHSEETKKKMSENRKGKKKSPRTQEHRDNMRKAQKERWGRIRAQKIF